MGILIMSSKDLSSPAGIHTHVGNLLHPGVRRDIADLNRLFLDRALDPGLLNDAWFQLPPATVGRLSAATAESLERAAGSPICLFELTIPGVEELAPWETGAVNDAASGAAADSLSESRRSFGLAALGVARRLAEGAPLTSRIAFGFDPAIQSRLAGLSLSAAYRLAAWPGLVQPRWHAHPRYWHLLAEAATAGCSETLHWAYAAGLCLLPHCVREPPAAGPGSRRQPRLLHRRPMPGGGDIPC
jgi:hypothetical protein